MSLLLALTVVTDIVEAAQSHGIERKPVKKPKRNQYEVDSFENVIVKPIKRRDDDEVLMLLLMQ